MRFKITTVHLWTLYYILLLPKIIKAGVFESINLNTPVAQEIMRQAKSAGMSAYIDNKLKPCDDFYNYACGNYAKIHPIEHTITSDFALTLQESYQRRVYKLLDKPKISTDSATETRVKYFSDSCRHRFKFEWNHAANLITIFREFGGFPALEGATWNETNFDPIDMMAKLLRTYGKVTLLNVQVAPGLNNSQSNRLYLGQRDDLKSEKSLYFGENLKQLEYCLMNLLRFNETYARNTVAEIGNVHLKLISGLVPPSDALNPGRLNRLRMLSDMTDSYGPALNLTRFVQTWLDHDYKLPVYEHGEGYLWKLKTILTETPKRKLANYMLATLLTDFDLVECGEITTEFFPEFVDHMVYRELEQQNPHIPGSMRQLWQELKESFAQMLRDKSWLDGTTLSEALTKLKAMTFHILGAETEEFHDDELVISSSDYFGNVRRVLEQRAKNLREKLQSATNPNYYSEVQLTPFYDRHANRVVMPASYMQHRYLFDDVYPLAIKYGTLGFILAREMAHGFDDLSRTFDAQGNLRDWWLRNSTDQFEQRKNCLIRHFSEFVNNDLALSRLQVQSENIADNIGVRIAHAAYQNWLAKQKATDSKLDTEVLPKLMLNSEQLFFVALGQMSCSNQDPDLSNLLNANEKPNLRLNAIMANFKAFGQTFECAEQAAMNPVERCAIF